mmetsp:Transcript_27364/g.54784  ORF Transcript_27364/g.54784 Transcript_27364/m.54784 type:complete len:201 (-) Transcript_27364:127-729(-)
MSIVRIIFLTRFLCSFSVALSLVPDAASLILRPSKLELKTFPSTGRGIQTTVDRPEKDVLLKVPLNETVTSSNYFMAKSNFSERVRRSLLMHPQLQLYVTLSEERATFSLDTKTKLPRESLQNGLTMLCSLANQLGFPNDDLLERDILNCLIQKRVDDLRKCLEGFDNGRTMFQGPDSDWLPFFKALELNLKDELSLLAA